MSSIFGMDMLHSLILYPWAREGASWKAFQEDRHRAGV